MSAPVLIASTAAVFAVLLALAVLAQRKRTAVRAFFILGLLGLGAEAACAALEARATSLEEVARWHAWSLVAMSAALGPWVFFSSAYARGRARGAGSSRRFLPVYAGGLLLCFAGIYRSDLVELRSPSALDFQTVLTLQWPAFVLHLGMLAGCIWILVNLERTFRAAVGTVRWRIKYMVIGAGLLFSIRLFASTHTLLSQWVLAPVQTVETGALWVSCLLMARSLFRTGHFEMDVYPSPALLRSSITLVLAGLYLVAVGLLWKFASVEILGSFALKAFFILVALAAFAGALLSDRAHWLVRRFVSRHLQRPFYDYRSVWRAFTEDTATQLDEESLCQSLVKRVSDLFEAKSVSLWLATDDGGTLRCAASSAWTASGAAGTPPSEAESRLLLARCLDFPEPEEIESGRDPSIPVLQSMHPKLFKKGGSRAAAPLVSRGSALGVLLLGDRVSGGGFGAQDLDMLRCVADHAASNVLNVRLTARSLQNRELEAFQSMATFFVHDLKNAASTLNLILPNLPVHWDNPEFRADALRGISKTVGHINALVNRLGQLRRERIIHPRTASLTQVLERALAGWQGMPEVSLVRSLEADLLVHVDEEQIVTVLSNLLLNARDAILEHSSGRGLVTVATRAQDAWAVISVSDTGCGMSPEFVQQSLFRPFQTTKKNGLGIGMFQSKAIVEAHGGRMSVVSAPGRGTTFEVFLPCVAPPEEAPLPPAAAAQQA